MIWRLIAIPVRIVVYATAIVLGMAIAVVYALCSETNKRTKR